MKATRTVSVRWATFAGAVALATAGHVGLGALIGTAPAAAAGTIAQSAPTKGSVMHGNPFSAQLQTSGNIGPVTFATDSSTTWGTVSSTGLVSAPDTALPGTYILFGTDADSSGDTGVWRYQLTVTYTIGPLTQTGSTSGSVPMSTSSAFTDQLNATGNIGPVTFTGGGTGLTVSSTGQIATTGTLPDGTYTATGTMADAYLDKGSFTYTLDVGAITQTGPTSGSVPVTTSSTFTDQLNATGGIGAVTFTGGGTDLTVSSTGQITTTGALAAGTYTASGTVADAFGDAGPFTYTLAVGTITLIAPMGTVTTTGSAAFTDQLNTTGNDGLVTFTGGGTDLTVSSTGQIATTGTLAAGSYTATGTVADAFGDAGPFTYTLTVDPVIITQTTPTTGSVKALTPFTDQLTTSGNIGSVTFTTTSTTPAFTVSASGAVSAPGTLPVASYTVSGTDTDAYGDSGSWTYTLTVTPANGNITQTAPTTGSVTTTGSAAFTSQLNATGNDGPVSYAQAVGGTGLTVSSSGQIATTGTLTAGDHTATGTVTDAFGDSGPFTFTLTVDPVVITQTIPTTGSVKALTPFTDQLATSGNIGSVTFTTTSTTPAFTVSASGAVAAAANLPAASYTVSGTDTDAYGDSGGWTYTLTVTSADGTITQTAPTTGSVTTSGSAAFTGQLKTTGNDGPVTFTGGGTGLTVSSTGKITTTGTLAKGTYTATGTEADAFGDSGTFTYTLTIKKVTITQTAPTTGTVKALTAFTDQLATSGNFGTVTFTTTSNKPAFTVSASGAVAVPLALPVGNYTVSGNDTDAFGDSGRWTYTLTVTPADGTITQTAPTTGSVTTSGSSTFTGRLETTGNDGPVTFTGGGTDLTVSPGGKITTTGTLAKGTYKATGTEADAFGDSGTFTYTLTVKAVTITQAAPVAGTVKALIPFTDQLATVANIGSVTFTITSTKPAFTVSASGAVTAPGTLPMAKYTVSGTDTDAFGDSGKWTYALTVTSASGAITQTSPTTGTVTTTGSAAFTDQLNTTGNDGQVTFTGGGTGLKVSSGGKITTTGTLAKGTYTATGTVADAFGDTGTFSYTLTVKVVNITQTAPTTGTVTTTGSAAFTDHFNTTGSVGKRRFVKTGGGTGLTVSFGGKIATTGTLAKGTYKATGTVADAFGDTGTFAYTLTVKAVTIIQTAPTTGTVTTTGSAAFTDHFNTTGSVGKRRFVKTGGGTGLKVSFGGMITTTGTLAKGTYKATGTVADGFGDTGTFTYTLTVKAVTITQIAPTTGTVTTTGSAAFTDHLNTTGSVGKRRFVKTGGGTGLKVSFGGMITTTGTLAKGTYKATGTVADGFGDTGTFTYTLTVTAAPISQTAPSAANREAD